MTHDEITRLPPAARLALIGELWDSLADIDVPFPQAQREELDRRLGTFETDRAESVSWDDLKAELARKR